MSRLTVPLRCWGCLEGRGLRQCGRQRLLPFVIGAQSFEPCKPLLIRRPGGDILSALDLVSFPLQAGKQIFQAGGCGYPPVDGGFQLCLVAGAVLCGLMLNVALALVPTGDDDGQAVFSAQPVTGPAYFVIATLIGMVVLMVGEADRIEDQMIMNMPLINMGGKYKLVLATQYFFANCSPISWASAAETSPGSKAWIRWRPRCVPLSMEWRRVHSNSMSAVSAAQPKEDTKQLPVRLVGIADIVNGGFQR